MRSAQDLYVEFGKADFLLVLPLEAEIGSCASNIRFVTFGVAGRRQPSRLVV